MHGRGSRGSGGRVITGSSCGCSRGRRRACYSYGRACGTTVCGTITPAIIVLTRRRVGVPARDCRAAAVVLRRRRLSGRGRSRSRGRGGGGSSGEGKAVGWGGSAEREAHDGPGLEVVRALARRLVLILILPYPSTCSHTTLIRSKVGTCPCDRSRRPRPLVAALLLLPLLVAGGPILRGRATQRGHLACAVGGGWWRPSSAAPNNGSSSRGRGRGPAPPACIPWLAALAGGQGAACSRSSDVDTKVLRLLY